MDQRTSRESKFPPSLYSRLVSRVPSALSFLPFPLRFQTPALLAASTDEATRQRARERLAAATAAVNDGAGEKGQKEAHDGEEKRRGGGGRGWKEHRKI